MSSSPGELARSAAARLAAAGVASPRVDAELLLAHVLGVRRSQLILHGPVEPRLAERYQALVTERCAGVPLQHLSGRAPFRHVELAVGPGVFIPRPETELITELAAGDLERASVVVDLCAGSGAIALAVANETAARRIIAVERSEAALAWLRRNAAERAALGDPPIEICPGDVTDPALLSGLAGQVDVVLSNPPYVPESIATRLAPEIAHDPHEAVFAGADGLALLPALVRLAARLLRPDGFLALEHDESQPEAVSHLLASSGEWTAITGHRDLAGRARFASARRRP